MKRVILSGLSILAVGVLLLSAAEAGHKTPGKEGLDPLWESARVLRIPESVCYDGKRDVLYVANIDGKPAEKDNRGFISKLSMAGKVIALEWITGLHAPKGMGVAGDTLYVTDIDVVAKIDIKKGKILARCPAEGAKFLNDIAVDGKGNVYVSDSVGNRLYRLSGDKLGTWLEAPELVSPNGLYMERDSLLVGTRDAVLRIDPVSRKIETYIAGTGRIDGLKPGGRGNYLVSDWMGRVHLVHPKKNKVLLLDTTPQKINAADFEFIPSKRLLLVPTFYDNRVTAYHLK